VYGDSTWSPDGHYVVFSSLGNGLFQARADGASQPHALTQSRRAQQYTSFTPDGRRLAYVETAGNPQIWTVPLEDQGGQLKAGKPEQFLKSSFADGYPVFSLDGRWLAYQSNESGKTEVYVRAFPPPSSGQSGKWQISNSGGVDPKWSRNGRELFFESLDSRIMVAAYTVKDDSFAAGKPRVWSETRLANTGFNPNYDLAPDGKRIAVIMPPEAPEDQKAQTHVIFLQNFFDEVRRRTAAVR
jgi:serine/threonine-protein kinase